MPAGTPGGRVYPTKNHRAKSTDSRVIDVESPNSTKIQTIIHPSTQQCKRNQQLPPADTVVFLVCEGSNPAFDPRLFLIMAGDVEENPGPETNKRRCHQCSKTIRADHPALKCAHQGCHNLSHKSAKCSKIGKYRSKDNWTCSIHNTNNVDPAAVDPTTVDPTSAPPADATVETAPRKKRYCSQKGCGTICKQGSGEFQCIICHGYFHQRCTKLSRAVIADIKARKAEWKCNKCEDELSQSAVPPTIPTFNETASESAGRATGTHKDTLRIIQWNADTISTKALELQERLMKDDIDICLIQESKLSENSRTPRFEGYVGIRADRKLKNVGGGLLTLIRSTLTYEPLDSVAIEGTETQSVRVSMDKKNWLYITNVYTPPCNSIGQDSIKLRTDAIPAFKSSLICGDLNAHSSLWDSIQPTDDRGEQVVDFAIDRELTILNDGSPTRVNRITGKESSPDVTLCGAKWADKSEWSVGECIGASDHSPIYITISTRVNHQSVFGKRPRWRSNGINWDEFANEVKDKLSPNPLKGSFTSRIAQFTKILTDAGHKHVGKVKPGRKTRVWLTPPVRAAIRQRNYLRRKIKTHRREWLEQCEVTRAEIEKAKQQKWKDVVEEAITTTDDRKIWSFVKSISGTPDAASTGEVMKHKGKVISSNSRKANIFSSHYASVSKLTFDKNERSLNREAKRMLNSKSVGHQSCRPFTMSDLKTAIRKMKSRGAPGADDIPPSFIKALDPTALAVLLSLFNESFEGATIPQAWRFAIIIPLLKMGKPSSALGSYRPVSLTSCLVKTLERMIADRLYAYVESNNLLSNLQAGFRRNLSCEDQILKVTQLIEDGFQKKKPERSILILLDYSKAFDQVWRQKLLLSLHQKNIPMQYIRWLNAFLSERRARVNFANSTSKTRLMKQGLPQGSVLSPLLFILFINNLAELMPPEAQAAFFADDVTLLATNRDRALAEKEAQALVDIVATWSKEWKLSLNADKCESSFFSTNTHEANWSPSIVIDGKVIKHEPTPRLLGVVLDRTLCFGPHTDVVTKSASSKLKILAKLSYADWGSDKFELFRIYEAVVRSRLDYAGPAWQPWLSDTQMKRLDVVQNRGLRLVTGQTRSTNLESLRCEADTLSYNTISQRATLRSYEKAARLPASHPRRQLLDNQVPKRNQRNSWRSTSLSLSSKLPYGAQDRLPLAQPVRPPWTPASNYTVHPFLPGVNRKEDIQADKLRAISNRVLQDHGANIVIFTDGSASGGTLNGGSAAIITTGDLEYPETTTRILKRGALFTSSFEEELQAMENAISWCIEHQAPQECVLIATDSQSLCQALLGNGVSTHQLKLQLDLCCGRIIIQWIPGHAEVAGNELADAAAKDAAADRDDLPRPTSYKGIIPTINTTIKDPPHEHARTQEVYQHFSKKKDKTLSRKDQVMLGRLRSGHSLLFEAYKHRIAKSLDPLCKRCNAGVDDTVEHWLVCDSTACARMDIFGHTNVELGDLTLWPRKSVALARKTLFRGVEQC